MDLKHLVGRVTAAAMALAFLLSFWFALMYGLANYSGITGAFYVAAVVNLFLLPSITDAALFLSPL
jgi:hypothetical protein